MSSIKGFPTQQKITADFGNLAQASKSEFNTLQPSADERNAQDVVARSMFRVGSATVPRTAGAGTGNQTDNTWGTYVVDTATPAKIGDVCRFNNGGAALLEYAIIAVDTNGFRLAARISTPPAAADTFYIMRYASQRVDDTGSPIVSVTSGPAQFVLDGVDVEVEEDTATPANSRPLPVKSLNSYLDSVRHDYNNTPITDAAWVELIADTGAEAVNAIMLFDGGGYAMELGIGAAAAEVRTLLIPPGGFNGLIPFFIPANSRLSIRGVGTPTVSAGELDLNLMR